MESPIPSRPRGRLERLARERHERDLALTRQPGGHPKGYRWDLAAGDRVISFIETYCRHWKGEWAGQLIQLTDDQKWIVRVLFGWKRPDGTRRFRKGWIELCRKNAKTTLAAAIGLYLLVADNEPGAEVYTTATAKEQARICLTDMVQMVKASPELRRFVKHMRSNGGTLVVERLGSKATALSADSGTKDGLSPHGDIRDEVHEWTDHDLAAKLDTAQGARRQPLTLEITTAGVYDQESVGWQHHEYAVQILEGLFEDDRFFVFIAAVDDEDNPLHDPSCWGKANPLLGVSCKVDFLKEQVEEAKNRPSEANKILRMHFGRWTSQVTRWLDVERWRQSDPTWGAEAVAGRAEREESLRGRVAFGGLDLSSKSDLAAFVLVLPGEDGWVDLVARFYLPELAIERELKKKGRRHYRDWVDQGWIHATPGSEVIDYEFIERDIADLSERYEIREIGFDPYNATQIAVNLQRAGFAMVEVRQGARSLSEPCKFLEGKILERKVRHGGNPVLAWCVSNAVARSDANGNIAPDKERAKDKIDGVSATVTALNRFVAAAPEEESLVASEGLLVLG